MTDFPADHFTTLAAYNRWANDRLYNAVAALPEADYRACRPSFFGSIHATLNHILVGDRLWLARLPQWTPPAPGVPTRLDEILYPDLASLRAARAAEDARIVAMVEGIDMAALPTVVSYHDSQGNPQRTPLRWILTHLFNHQTHHRGQVHDMLAQTPVAPPPLDLIYYLRQSVRA